MKVDRGNGHHYIMMDGIWIPSQSEIDELEEYPSPDSAGRKVMFNKSRGSSVSIVLSGRDRNGGSRVKFLSPGKPYYIHISSDIVRSRKTKVRRIAKVYFYGESQNDLSLEYLMRPITMLEAWRSIRGTCDLERRYASGEVDRISQEDGELFLASLGLREDREHVGGSQLLLPAYKLQARMDEMDWFSPEIHRPDWSLVL